MPDSPRQKFIVKIRQCINLLNRVEGYMNKIKVFVKESEFYNLIDHIYIFNRLNISSLEAFLKKVNDNGSYRHKRNLIDVLENLEV